MDRRLMRELSSAPQGHLFELLVLPGAERRGNQECAAQLARSPLASLGENAPGELRPTAENAGNSPQSLRCGPSAPLGYSAE
jgi:hypothetical protein